MKNLFAFVMMVILAASTFSCQKNIDDQNTQTIDSLVVVLEAAQNALAKLDTVAIDQALPEYDSFYTFFGKTYDRIDQHKFYTNQLDELTTCRKYIKRTRSELKPWKKEIDKTLHQLKTLKHDYENELLTAEECEKHLQTEWQATYATDRNVQKYAGFAAGCMRKWSVLSAQLDSARTDFLSSTNE